MDTVEKLISVKVNRAIKSNHHLSARNLEWLHANIDPYFFITMQEEVEAIAILAGGLQNLALNRRMILADRDKMLIMAVVNRPGSLYETLRTLQEREISYAHFGVSRGALPDSSVIWRSSVLSLIAALPRRLPQPPVGMPPP